MERLPDEIFVRIFDNLPEDDLLTCAAVSRHWQRVANDVTIWRPRIQRLVAPWRSVSKQTLVDSAFFACDPIVSCYR